MAGPTSLPSDYQRGFLHHRLPVRGCHLGHEDVPILKDEFVPGYVLDPFAVGQSLLQSTAALDDLSIGVVDPDGSGADSLAHGLTSRQHGTLFQSLDKSGVHLVSDEPVGGGFGVDRFRSSLDNVQAAIATVLGPFDIHRHAIVLLYSERHVG